MDMVTMNIIDSTMVSICREMGITMMKTSYSCSTIFNEGLDFTCGQVPQMVTMNIIDSTMVSICREMGITMMKTSYSTIFNEGLDFTSATRGAS